MFEKSILQLDTDEKQNLVGDTFKHSIYAISGLAHRDEECFMGEMAGPIVGRVYRDDSTTCSNDEDERMLSRVHTFRG